MQQELNIDYVDVAWSKIKQNIAEILKNQGFIENFLVKQDNNKRGTMQDLFKIYRRYDKSVIQGLTRVSKPGLTKYVRT